VARRRRQQRPISHPELRAHDLPAQDLELVAQHQQLDVFHMQAATATNERAEQCPHREVKKREGHTADTPNPHATEGRHQYWRPTGELEALQAIRKALAGFVTGSADLPATRQSVRRVFESLTLRRYDDGVPGILDADLASGNGYIVRNVRADAPCKSGMIPPVGCTNSVACRIRPICRRIE
jgi:hypothetical protein